MSKNCVTVVESRIYYSSDLNCCFLLLLLLRVTFQTLRGFTDAQSSLCSHAMGAGNYHLTGQYVQLSLITSVICGILLAFFVDTFTYDMLVSLDMSADIAFIGQQWAAVAVWAGVLNGINEAFFQFMNVIDTEMYSSVIIAMMNAINTFGMAVSLMSEDATLVHVALVKLGTVVLFIVINFVFMSWKGWLDLCWSGLVGSISFTVGVYFFVLFTKRATYLMVLWFVRIVLPSNK